MRSPKVASLVLAVILGAAMLSSSVMAKTRTNRCGRGGSPYDERGGCETKTNEVRCGRGGRDILIGYAWADEKGVQVCNDSRDRFLLQGRTGFSTQGSGSVKGPVVYTDGDKDNADVAPATNGWARVDSTGLQCYYPGQQSFNSGPGGGECIR